MRLNLTLIEEIECTSIYRGQCIQIGRGGILWHLFAVCVFPAQSFDVYPFIFAKLGVTPSPPNAHL